jgi:acyl carrier protein
MKIEEIIEKANAILVEEFEVDIDTISPEANLRDTLSLDSLDYVDLVVSIESISGVKLGEEDFKDIVTFEDFYNVLHKKVLAKTEG